MSGIPTDANNNSTDIYIQEFYLFAYSSFMKFKENSGVTEHNDEASFVPAEKEPITTRINLFWMTQAEIARWNHKLRRFVKRIPD